MGIESDQLVYDYLSRVGDLAQATTLTAAERARLVIGLRQTIDDRRGGASAGSRRTEKAAVEKILSGIGEPADVVRQAVHHGVPEAAPAPVRAPGGGEGPSVPVQRPPGSRPGADRDRGPDEAGSGPDDWWRSQEDADGGRSPLVGESIGELPGWRAVYEADFLDPEAAARARIPEQRPPLTDDRSAEEAEEAEAAEVPGGDGGAVPGPTLGRLLRRRLGRATPPPAAEPELPRPPRRPLPLVETLAALVLVAAAVLGLWYVAVLGWFFAYSSRRLGQRVAHTAGLWLPLWLAVAAGLLLYSRAHGHPGQQETSAAFQSALHAVVVLWLRVAPATSAAFLAWRIGRRP
ncbi:hypothetical protein [Streptacidiphilus sp. P02-A3a]|uniref:hypothetical protein n=1 Tax=Streptacidiphilus sp. P02-A3a TaxID=2704468 RepID=UPI0015F89A64|nr:hypothetical protein [Streptacidiphilus sp. P02-A3a]QMU67491.1 hypothetical protein GXP74_03885 [Streptacidiphilus sp. P02-A3a]